jgi:Fungal Zn(2)-Cys(6) binuclear cluster domain
MEGVAHNFGPQRKRRRVEKACEPCRRRKERCDGIQPKCSNCQLSGRQCDYSSETKKRGLPEGWLRALEKFWAIAIQRAPGLEDDVISVVTASLREPQDAHLAALWTDEADDRGLLKSWRASRLAAELEGLLPSLERFPQLRIDDPSLESVENGKILI